MTNHQLCLNSMVSFLIVVLLGTTFQSCEPSPQKKKYATFQEGVELYKQNNLNASVEKFEEAEAYNALADLYASQLDYHTALKYLDAKLAKDTTRGKIFQRYGLLYEKIGDYQMARKCLLLATELKKDIGDYTKLYNDLARVSEKDGAYHMAIHAYEEVLKRDLNLQFIPYDRLGNMKELLFPKPEMSHIYLRLADLKHKMGLHEQAVGYAKAAMFMNNRNCEAKIKLALIYIDKEAYSEALKQVQEITSGLRTFGRLCWIEAKSLDKVLETLQTIRKLPLEERTSVYHNLALEMISFEEYQIAAKYLHRALDIDPVYLEARMTLGKLRYLNGAYKRAYETFLHLVKVDSLAAESYYYMARSAQKLEQHSEAIRLYKYSAQLRTAEYNYCYEMAYSHYQLKQFDKALEFFQACPNSKRSILIKAYMGVCHFHRKNYDTSRTLFE